MNLIFSTDGDGIGWAVRFSFDPACGAHLTDQSIENSMLASLSSSGLRRNRQVHGCAWPGHQYAECGWFVYTSIHGIEVIGTEFKDV
jgi:hypothetical protein